MREEEEEEEEERKERKKRGGDTRRGKRIKADMAGMRESKELM